MRICTLLVSLMICRLAFCAGPMGLEGMGDVAPGAETMPSRGSEVREERLRAEKEQATAVFSKLKTDLDMVLKTVSAYETLSPESIAEIERDFIATKRVYRYLDKAQQSDMMLLEAWLLYYKSANMEEALKRSERASMLNPTSGDAYASSVVFSVLTGQQVKPKAMIMRLAKKEKDMAEPQMSAPSLNVDIPDIAISLMGKKMQAAGGDTAEAEAAKPADEAAKTDDKGTYGCVLLWTLAPEAPNAADAEALKAARAQLPPDKREMLDQIMAAPAVTTDDVKSQVDGFTALYENNSAKDKVMFLSINIDEPTVLRAFIEEKKPQPTPIPGQNLPILTADMKKAMKMMGSITVITDGQGTIRYAGSSKGFLPVMLINSFVPGSQKMGEVQTAPAAENMMGGDGMTPLSPDMMPINQEPMPDQPQLPVAQPVKDSNSLPEATAPEGAAVEVTDEQRQENTNKMLPEQQTEAENLLTAARMFRGSHTKLGSSRKVVEDCMLVIQKFPGTTYEKEARQILDSVPAHQKKKYGIE